MKPTSYITRNIISNLRREKIVIAFLLMLTMLFGSTIWTGYQLASAEEAKVSDAQVPDFIYRYGMYFWPTGKPVKVVKKYDPPAQKWKSGSRGICLAYRDGAPVYAAASGTVHWQGTIDGTPALSVKHSDGWRTTYQPVKTKLKEGQTVKIGEVIGSYVEAKSPRGEYCLHFGVKRDDAHYRNPLPRLYGPIVLVE